jgi:hypothetical protein
MRRKRRSGWKHPLDINRNRRRCEKRRRSASAAVRHALDGLRGHEIQLELIEARRIYQARPERRGPKRRPARGLEPRRAW